jgi:hypothetical protein
MRRLEHCFAAYSCLDFRLSFSIEIQAAASAALQFRRICQRTPLGKLAAT